MLAYYLLLGALAFGAVAALDAFGSMVEATGNRYAGVELACACLAVALMVVAAAARSDASVPPLAGTALVCSVAVLAIHGALTLAARQRQFER